MLLILISLNSCSFLGFNEKSSITHKFDGFIIYDKPERIGIKIYKNCYIGDEIIECIKVDDFKKIVIRTRKLERIIYNYEQDIKDYKELKYQ